MNLKKNRRKEKRYLNHLCGKLKFGMYVEDCRYHPCIITEQNHWIKDFSCVSLLNNRPNGCSMYHCGPIPLTKAQAFERRDFMREHGWEAYLIKYIGYTEESIIEWRKMDAEWNFDKGEPRETPNEN
jgi:hypothetical protein